MINPRVEKVKALNNYKLVITFTNKEEKIFDMTPWINKGVFNALQDETLFNKAHVAWGTVVWNDDVDISPDTLYLESVAIN